MPDEFTDKVSNKVSNMLLVKALLYPKDEHYNVLTDETPETVFTDVNDNGSYAVCVHNKGPMTYESRRQLQIDPDDLKRARLAHANIRPAIVNDYTIDIETNEDGEIDFVRKDEHKVHALVHMNLSSKIGALCECEDGRMMRTAWENVRFTDTDERVGLFDWDETDDATKETQVEQND